MTPMTPKQLAVLLANYDALVFDTADILDMPPAKARAFVQDNTAILEGLLNQLKDAQ